MGIQYDRILDGFDGPFEKLPDVVTPGMTVVGPAPAGGGWMLSHQVNDAFVAVNRLLKARQEVYWLTKPQTTVGQTFAAGTMFIPAREGAQPILEALAKDKGLTFTPVPVGGANMTKLRAIRIGLWDQYGGSMPSGWTRWLFEQFEFPFEVVFPQTLDAGNLNAKFDVLVFVNGGIPRSDPDGGGPNPDSIPVEYRANLGRVTVSRTVPEIVKFIQNGGTVLTIGSSTSLGYHLGLPMRDALVERTGTSPERQLPREKFFIPGSLLDARVDTTHPLAYGMGERAMIMWDESPAFRLLPEAQLKGLRPVAWIDSPTPLRSGWAWGQQYLDQAVTVAEASVGQGHVVLFGPEVLWRAQPHGTFKLFFNALYYGSAAPASSP